MIDNEQLSGDFIELQYRQQASQDAVNEILSNPDVVNPISVYGYTPENAGNKNQVNGYAGLDGSAKIPNALINLLNAEGKLSSDVAITLANTFYDGPSVSLSSGKWLVTAHVTFGRTVAAVCNFTGRITTGAVHYASGEAQSPSATFCQSVCLTALITLGVTTTIKIQSTCTSTDGSMLAGTVDNNSGNNATAITAVRIG